MPNQKTIDIKSLSKELEKLIDATGDSCGPILIKELQERIDRSVDTFDKDVKTLMKNSFDDYGDKISFCKEILNNQQSVNKDSDSDSFDKKEINTPHFIKLYEKKFGKKL